LQTRCQVTDALDFKEFSAISSSINLNSHWCIGVVLFKYRFYFNPNASWAEIPDFILMVITLSHFPMKKTEGSVVSKGDRVTIS